MNFRWTSLHVSCHYNINKSCVVTCCVLFIVQPIETMKSLPYWASVTDLPFAGMDNDACKFTACPIAQGVNQTYDFQLNIAKSLPRVRQSYLSIM